MAIKMTIAPIAAVLTLGIIHGAASARAEHPYHRRAIQPHVKAPAETVASVQTTIRGRTALAVVSPQGRTIGADPDQRIRFQITREWPGGPYGK